jgi:dual-action HEIGH metallo-peptidase
MSMLSRIARRFLFATIAVQIGCRGDGPVAVQNSSHDDLLQFLLSQGFKENEIRDYGEYFVAEGDMVFPKSGLKAIASEIRPAVPIRKQWVTNAANGDTRWNGPVNVDIGGIGAAGWDVAAREAMAEWTAVDGVGFSVVEGTPAQITIRFEAISQQYVIARADFPTTVSSVGRTIRIDREYDYLSASEKKAVVTHELGHTFGLRHSNWQQNGETQNPNGANLILGTSPTDEGSIMNAVLQPWTGLSDGDQLAIIFRWRPVPVVSLSVPGTVSWQPLGRAVRYSVEFFWTNGIDPDGYPYKYVQLLGYTTDTTWVENTYNCDYPGYDHSGNAYFYVRAEYPFGLGNGWYGFCDY